MDQYWVQQVAKETMEDAPKEGQVTCITHWRRVPEDMHQHCTKSSLEWHENHLLGSIICLNTRNQDNIIFAQQLRKHIMSFKPLNIPIGKRMVWAHMCKPVLRLLGNLMQQWPSFWIWGIYYQSEWDGRHNRAAETAIMCTTSGKGKGHPDHLWMWGNLYEGTDNYTATFDSIGIHASNIMQHHWRRTDWLKSHRPFLSFTGLQLNVRFQINCFPFDPCSSPPLCKLNLGEQRWSQITDLRKIPSLDSQFQSVVT